MAIKSCLENKTDSVKNSQEVVGKKVYLLNSRKTEAFSWEMFPRILPGSQYYTFLKTSTTTNIKANNVTTYFQKSVETTHNQHVVAQTLIFLVLNLEVNQLFLKSLFFQYSLPTKDK